MRILNPLYAVILSTVIVACASSARDTYQQGIRARIQGDDDKAYTLLRKSCRQGESRACVIVAHIENEIGNKDISYDYYRMACDVGDSRACNTMGIMQEELGNRELAMEIFERECDKGYALSCDNLGFIEERVSLEWWLAALILQR